MSFTVTMDMQPLYWFHRVELVSFFLIEQKGVWLRSIERFFHGRRFSWFTMQKSGRSSSFCSLQEHPLKFPGNATVQSDVILHA